MSILFGVSAALICSGFLIYEISHALMSYQAKNWESCVGELSKWDIELVAPLGSFNNFRYKYVVSGKEYESNKIGFGFPLTVGESYPRMIFQYAAVALDEVLINAPRVTVYYSPDNPRNSVLCTGMQSWHVTKIAGFGFGLIIAILSVYL